MLYSICCRRCLLLKVKEVAQLVGISVRTLHYYDEIDLLTPEATSPTGYRLYSERNLERLQQILFFRNVGFSLKEIKVMLDNPNFDQLEALQLHRRILLDKRDNIDTLIKTVDKTIQHMKGEVTMTDKEKFQGFDFSYNPYEEEAREQWGDKAVDESNAKIAGMKERDKEMVSNIFRKLSDIRKEDPKSDLAQKAIKEWFDCLNQNFGTYSYEAFKGLGQMYVADERFTKNIDQFGEGLANFMRDAMKEYADKNM